MFSLETIYSSCGGAALFIGANAIAIGSAIVMFPFLEI